MEFCRFMCYVTLVVLVLALVCEQTAEASYHISYGKHRSKKRHHGGYGYKPRKKSHKKKSYKPRRKIKKISRRKKHGFFG